MWPSPRNPIFGIFVQRHVAALRASGVEVTVAANMDPRSGVARSFLKYAWLAVRSWREATHDRHDVVVAHYLYPTAAIAAIAARRARVPLVVVSHGTDAASILRGGVLGHWSRRAVGSASRVVAVSRALADALVASGVVSAGTQIPIVNMGIDTDVFSPDPSARERLGVGDDERVVLFAGALTQGKGVDVLIDAFSHLRKDDSADRLVVVGAGPHEAALRSAVEAHARAGLLDLGTRVQFTGRLEADALADWMNAADVFVLPSRAEGLGIVLLEAMACGTPCVGSDVGGIPEILLVPECGELAPPGDDVMLARRIGDVIARGKSTYSDACMRQAARYSVDTQARAMLAAIEEVVR
jgi:glycosyltransferase involved in cell wall biosynthesis